MLETMRNAIPKEVGGILRRIVGANEATERINSAKFKQQRRRIVNEHAFLVSLEDAILVLLPQKYNNVCLFFEDG